MEIDREHRQLETLLRLGAWVLPAVVLIGLSCAALAFYVLSLRPVAQSTIAREEARAIGEVRGRLVSGAALIERQLAILAGLAARGALDVDAPDLASRAMLATAHSGPSISGIVVARSDGRELFLRKADGAYTLRISDVDRHGDRKQLIDLTADGLQLRASSVNVDYDPRKRPWYVGALLTAPGDIFWTSAYRFKTSQRPGITASTRWMDDKGRAVVVAIDIELIELRRVARVPVGEHGYTVVLDDAGRVLATPALQRFADSNAVLDAVLRTPEELGLAELATALAERQGSAAEADDEHIDRRAFEYAGAHWRAAFGAQRLGASTLQIAAVYPESDYSPLTPRLLGLLAGALGGISLLVVVVMQWLARRLAKPINRIFDNLARSQADLRRELDAKAFLATFAADLQRQPDLATVGATALSALADRLRARHGLMVAATPAGLSLVASYGAGRTPRLDGAIADCARSGQAVRLTLPDDPRWRIRSGLGDTAPAEVHVLPIVYGPRQLGVLELASTHALDDQALRILADAATLLGMRMDDVMHADERGVA